PLRRAAERDRAARPQGALRELPLSLGAGSRPAGPPGRRSGCAASPRWAGAAGGAAAPALLARARSRGAAARLSPIGAAPAQLGTDLDDRRGGRGGADDRCRARAPIFRAARSRPELR